MIAFIDCGRDDHQEPCRFIVAVRLLFHEERQQRYMAKLGAPHLTAPKRRTSLGELEEGPLYTAEEAELLRTGQPVRKEFATLDDAERHIERLKLAVDGLPTYWDRARAFTTSEQYPLPPAAPTNAA